MVGTGKKRTRSAAKGESKSDNVASSRTDNRRITASSRRRKNEGPEVPANTTRFKIPQGSTKLVPVQQEEESEKEERQEKAVEEGQKKAEEEGMKKAEEEGDKISEVEEEVEKNNEAEVDGDEEGGDEDGEVDGEEEDGEEEDGEEKDGDEDEDHWVANDISSPFESERHFDRRIVNVRQQRDSKGKFMRLSESSSSTSTGRPKKDYSWMLKGPLTDRGGPDDFTVLISYAGHTTYQGWNDPTKLRGPIKCYDRAGWLSDLDGVPLSDEVIALTGRTFLTHLSKSMVKNVDENLISAFIERWQPDTNTFHMPFGEMSITLHDVEEILGIPVDGKAVNVGGGMTSQEDEENGREDPELKARLAVLLGLTEEQMVHVYKGGGVSVGNLLMVVKDGNDLDASRAYLMLLLGQTLFLDKSGDKVRARLLHLCQDLEHVSGFAWGTATLAYIYRQLGMASRAKARGITGCVSLLQAWIYEYFPCFRPHGGYYVNGEARVLAWKDVPRFSRSDATMERYRQRLDAMKSYDVCWLPYGPEPAVKCPLTLYHGLIRYFNVVEPYSPDRFLRQFGYCQIRPQGMRMPADFARPADPKAHYFNNYGEFVDLQWVGRMDNVITLGDKSRRAKMPFDVHPMYMEWFLKISHPYVLSPANRICFVPRGRLHEHPEVSVILSRGLAQAYEVPEPQDRIAYLDWYLNDMAPYFLIDRPTPPPS